MNGNYAFVVDRDSADVAGTAQRPLQVALLGFGTVGRSGTRILVERPELGGRLHLTHVFNRGVSRKRADWVPESVTWTWGHPHASDRHSQRHVELRLEPDENRR